MSMEADRSRPDSRLIAQLENANAALKQRAADWESQIWRLARAGGCVHRVNPGSVEEAWEEVETKVHAWGDCQCDELRAELDARQAVAPDLDRLGVTVAVALGVPEGSEWRKVELAFIRFALKAERAGVRGE